MLEPIYTITETAEYLKVSERTVHRMLRDLDIIVFRVRRQIRIPESSVLMMLDREGFTTDELNHTVKQLYED